MKHTGNPVLPHVQETEAQRNENDLSKAMRQVSPSDFKDQVDSFIKTLPHK